MLDGRIDTQGVIKELRARGVLDDITHEESVEAHKEEQAAEVAEKSDNPNAEVDADAEAENGDPKPADKKNPRKLIEDEKRETGNVKWSIYHTYLKASCVALGSIGWRCMLTRPWPDRTGHGLSCFS